MPETRHRTETDRFVATVGVNPGYQHNNEVGMSVQSFADAWAYTAFAIERLGGLYITAVVSEGRAVFPGIKGCPPGGEVVFVATGTRNPMFNPDAEAWRNSAVEIVNRLRVRFEQVTAQIVFDTVEMVYFREER